jgi:hypothetical protein
MPAHAIAAIAPIYIKSCHIAEVAAKRRFYFMTHSFFLLVLVREGFSLLVVAEALSVACDVYSELKKEL